MKIKCLRNFAGAVSGRKDVVLDVSDATANDLISAGYADPVEEVKTVKAKPVKKAKA